MNSAQVRTGQRAGYFIVEWTHEWDPDLRDLIIRMPELVLGCQVAIVSCDSGPYAVSDDERNGGWTVSGRIALSPILAAIDMLPMPGFDEWHVFPGEPTVFPSRAFVNRWGFSTLASGDPDTEAFWAQVEVVQPLHVLGAGTPAMFLVTRDAQLARHAATWPM